MKIGILGTGMVGNALGTKLIQRGHEVTMGSRSATNEAAQKWTASLGERAHSNEDLLAPLQSTARTQPQVQPALLVLAHLTTT